MPPSVSEIPCFTTPVLAFAEDHWLPSIRPICTFFSLATVLDSHVTKVKASHPFHTLDLSICSDKPTVAKIAVFWERTCSYQIFFLVQLTCMLINTDTQYEWPEIGQAVILTLFLHYLYIIGKLSLFIIFQIFKLNHITTEIKQNLWFYLHMMISFIQTHLTIFCI